MQLGGGEELCSYHLGMLRPRHGDEAARGRRAWLAGPRRAYGAHGEGLTPSAAPAARPTELLTLTPWLAPIVSEGTFDPELLRLIYQPLNLTVGLTVFAVGK